MRGHTLSLVSPSPCEQQSGFLGKLNQSLRRLSGSCVAAGSVTRAIKLIFFFFVALSSSGPGLPRAELARRLAPAELKKPERSQTGGGLLDPREPRLSASSHLMHECRQQQGTR